MMRRSLNSFLAVWWFVSCKCAVSGEIPTSCSSVRLCMCVRCLWIRVNWSFINHTGRKTDAPSQCVDSGCYRSRSLWGLVTVSQLRTCFITFLASWFCWSPGAWVVSSLCFPVNKLKTERSPLPVCQRLFPGYTTSPNMWSWASLNPAESEYFCI